MAQQAYTVKQGDTLSRVASQYGVNLADITGYASGDPNKIGVGENLTINTRDTMPANTAPATAMGGTPYKVPPPAPVTAYDGLIASTNAAITDLGTKTDDGKTKIEDTYDRLGDVARDKASGYKKEGVYDKKAAYTNEVNLINQKELAYQARIDKIRNSNPDGQLQGGQEIQMDKLTKDWAIEKAALSISAAFKKDDYELAKSIVDDRITAETEGLTNELEGLKFFYSQNYNQLSDERKSLLQFQIQNIEDEKKEKENKLAEIGNIQLAAAENGAPASVIKAISGAEDLTAAISAAGSWIDKTIDRDPSDDSNDSTIDLAPEDERILAGSGFSTQDIKDLKKSVAEFGIEATLKAIEDPAQKEAVRKVYNVAATINRASIEAAVTKKMAQDALTEQYTDTELEDIARSNGFASFWKSKSKEKSNFLASDKAYQYYIDSLVQQYKAAGMFQE